MRQRPSGLHSAGVALTDEGVQQDPLTRPESDTLATRTAPGAPHAWHAKLPPRAVTCAARPAREDEHTRAQARRAQGGRA